MIVSFTWGTTGWFYEVPGRDGALILPKDMNSKAGISRWITDMRSAAPTSRFIQ